MHRNTRVSKSATPTARRKTASSGENYHHGDLRAALIAAAESLLIESGVENFTLRECARRAGVSHAAPAHHFGDARGLLTEVAAVGFERLSVRVADYVARAPEDPAKQLTAVGQAYIDFALAHRAHFQLMFRHDRLDADNARLRQTSQATFDALLAAITRVSAPAEPMPRTFEAKIVLAWSAVHGFATLFLEGALAQMADGQSPAGFARQCSADMLRQLEGALVSAARAEPALESSLHATAISRRR